MSRFAKRVRIADGWRSLSAISPKWICTVCSASHSSHNSAGEHPRTTTHTDWRDTKHRQGEERRGPLDRVAVFILKPAGAGAKFDGGGRLGTPPGAFVRTSHPWQLVRTSHPWQPQWRQRFGAISAISVPCSAPSQSGWNTHKQHSTLPNIFSGPNLQV